MSKGMILHEGGLAFHMTDGEPRILDLNLAIILGYERPRKIRDIIERFSNEIGVCPTVGQTSARGGRPAREYWLTEEQALFVAAKSETPKATAILKAVIAAFVAVRRQIIDGKNAVSQFQQRLLEAVVASTPDEWELMFHPSLVRAMCDLYGFKWSGGSHPVGLRNPNRKIYEILVSTPIAKEIKRRNPFPKFRSNHHQNFTPEARRYFSAQLVTVEALARTSSSRADFWRRMKRQYSGGMLQLSLTDPERRN